jgi:hypothetical protein
MERHYECYKRINQTIIHTTSTTSLWGFGGRTYQLIYHQPEKAIFILVKALTLDRVYFNLK